LFNLYARVEPAYRQTGAAEARMNKTFLAMLFKSEFIDAMITFSKKLVSVPVNHQLILEITSTHASNFIGLNIGKKG
jgi:hypothetical protein